MAPAVTAFTAASWSTRKASSSSRVSPTARSSTRLPVPPRAGPGSTPATSPYSTSGRILRSATTTVSCAPTPTACSCTPPLAPARWVMSTAATACRSAAAKLAGKNSTAASTKCGSGTPPAAPRKSAPRTSSFWSVTKPGSLVTGVWTKPAAATLPTFLATTTPAGCSMHPRSKPAFSASTPSLAKSTISTPRPKSAKTSRCACSTRAATSSSARNGSPKTGMFSRLRAAAVTRWRWKAASTTPRR